MRSYAMRSPYPILIAEDSAADVELLQIALPRAGFTGFTYFVRDGQEAIDYLEGAGQYADRSRFPFPRVLVTDLKMPRLDGFQLLHWLRTHPRCSIPVILLSSSELQEDIQSAYKLGANTYFQKPSTFDGLVALLKQFQGYWSKSEVPRSLASC